MANQITHVADWDQMQSRHHLSSSWLSKFYPVTRSHHLSPSRFMSAAIAVDLVDSTTNTRLYTVLCMHRSEKHTSGLAPAQRMKRLLHHSWTKSPFTHLGCWISRLACERKGGQHVLSHLLVLSHLRSSFLFFPLPFGPGGIKDGWMDGWVDRGDAMRWHHSFFFVATLTTYTATITQNARSLIFHRLLQD